MQVAGQNNNIQQQRPILPSACCCHSAQQPAAQQQAIQTQPAPVQTVQPQAQNSAAQYCQVHNAPVTKPQTVPTQNAYPAGYVSPQNMYPQYQPQAQSLQVQPSTSGVNIQIINPSVGTPGAAPTYNVNAPCYPSGYYTGSVGPDGKMYPNNSGVGQQGNNTNNGTVNGNVNTGTNNGTIGNNNNNNGTNGTNGSNGNNNGTGQTGNNTNNGTVDGNVNTGVNNGTIGNGNYSNNVTNNTTTIDNTEKKKTEKRKIVELTDDYIRNLESYLDSQDKQVRLNAAKEVYARLEEDESRFDDKALNALVNKMLQDPSREIRFLALTALDGRICKGDDYTVNVLQRMQANNDDPLNQEAADASSILLKMSGRQVEKEFEVKDKKDKKANEMSDKFKPEGAKI